MGGPTIALWPLASTCRDIALVNVPFPDHHSQNVHCGPIKYCSHDGGGVVGGKEKYFFLAYDERKMEFVLIILPSVLPIRFRAVFSFVVWLSSVSPTSSDWATGSLAVADSPVAKSFCLGV